MIEPHKCLAGCGKTITWQFAICAECEQSYGSSPVRWPEWLRYLWIVTLRERRNDRKIMNWEVSYDTFGFQEMISGRRYRYPAQE